MLSNVRWSGRFSLFRRRTNHTSPPVGCGGRIRTDDLRVMSPTSYLTAPPRYISHLTYQTPAISSSLPSKLGLQRLRPPSSPVPEAGLEPARILTIQWILSPLRLPIPPLRLLHNNNISFFFVKKRWLLPFCLLLIYPYLLEPFKEFASFSFSRVFWELLQGSPKNSPELILYFFKILCVLSLAFSLSKTILYPLSFTIT